MLVLIYFLWKNVLDLRVNYKKNKNNKKKSFQIGCSAHKSHKAFENSTFRDNPSVFAHVISVGLGIPVSAQLI